MKKVWTHHVAFCSSMDLPPDRVAGGHFCSPATQTEPAAPPPPPFSARVARPSGGGQGGRGLPSGPPTYPHIPPLYPPSPAHPRRSTPPPGPAQRIKSPPQRPFATVLCSFVVCDSHPSKHLVGHLHVRIPPSNTTRRLISLPCPPHNIPPPAHFMRRVIRFPSFRFARTLPSSPACIHRIPFAFSPNPEPQAPAHCACRGGCDRMIASSTVRQFMTTS